MNPIRVLIADDAVVVRRMLSDVLAKDPEIEVVGTASNGRTALTKLSLVEVDVLVLDVEMPELDGLQTLDELAKRGFKQPVIMFSSLTEAGASATLEALSRGAADYVTKPSGTRSAEEAIELIRSELIPKIKAAVGRQGRSVAPRSQSMAPFVPAPRLRDAGELELLAIGASTGGPNALAQVIPKFGQDFPIPIVVTQHMPPVFTRYLAERLDTESKLRVIEVTRPATLTAGTVYLAAGNYHLRLDRDGRSVVATPDQGPPENSCRPAVDVMFRSAAEAFSGRVLGVVLTGMGQDGMRGAERIRELGGRVFAQDERTSVVWGMPGFVVRHQLAEKVLALGDIASEIVAAVTTTRRRHAAGGR